jgi:hypothetical protein
VVHSDTVGRTQIYLGTDELELLDRVARVTGASRSELVRRAVRSTFGQPTKADKLQALQASAGSWRGRDFTGAEYVDSARGDLNQRLGPRPRVKLLDTTVAIDHLRGDQVAVDLLRGLVEQDRVLAASEIVRFELLAGLQPPY